VMSFGFHQCTCLFHVPYELILHEWIGQIRSGIHWWYPHLF
jgi:hypothetical protein